MNALLAGAATVDITPPVGGLMDGYGARREGSQGVRDPLMARALVLESGGQSCAIVSCDLLGMHEGITREVRRRAHAETGIPEEAVMLAATHNHAGPAGLRGGMFSRLDEPLAQTLVERLAGAILAAHEARRPAALRAGSAVIDTMSMNRRHPDWPIDPLLRVLLVDGEDPGGRTAGPIASVVNFACHATVLSGANLLLSGEFAGAVCRLLQEQTGAPCIYLNGACGNVNPVWIKQDFESVARVGQIIGGQALRLIGELRTLGPGQRAHNIRWDEFPEKPAPGRTVDPSLRAAQRQVELPLRPFAGDAEYAARTAALEESLGVLPAAGSEERREAMAQLTRAQNERWAASCARRQPAKTAQRAEVQALALGDGLALLALPGEFFVETAAAVRTRCSVEDLLIACYANDYIGYVIPPDAYEQGGYESGITFCGPEAEGIIVDASLALLKEIADGG